MIKPKVYEDIRGYFFESFREDILSNFLGYKINFTQDNESKSSQKTLRGLHYQLPPFAQTKLVRVVMGNVIDIAVDLRKSSPTFGQYAAVELSEENKHQLLIPKGFAHGFIVLSELAIFSYKVDNPYSREFERGVAYNDPSLNIKWPFDRQEIIISDKDKNLPSMKNNNDFFL